MDKEMFRKSLTRSISIISNTNGNIHEEKENRIRAMMQTYLII